VGIGLALYFVSYPFEVSGEFRIQPYLKSEIRAEVQGLIESVAYEEGAEVEKGTVLFRLSNRQLEQEYNSAKASLERETQQLRELLVGPKPEEIKLQRQKIKLAETSLSHSEVLLKQYETLVKEGSVAERDYNKVLKERDMDRESVEVAKLELEDLLSGEREETIAAQRAEVERLAFSLKYYGDELARMTVRSPINGRLTTLYLQAKTGGRVDAGDVLAIVEDTKKVKMRIAVPEEVAGLVSVGARVRARPWAYSDRDFEGEVTTIMPVAVEKTEDLMKQESSEEEGGMVRNMSMPQEKVVPILAEIQNENRLLKTDMTGYAKIEVGDRSLGYALFHPIIRFFRVLVWSWIP
jgi:multidrug resistance efflux pump